MGFVGDFIDNITGKSAADAAENSARLQAQSAAAALAELRRGKEEGQGYLAPFEVLGQQGLNNRNILTDPAAQYAFLQNNPLFKLALENANIETNKFAAARGRLSAGDTLQKLSKNVLSESLPFLMNQQNNVSRLLGFGTDLATNQANTALGVGSQAGSIQQDIGNSLAAGQIGAANAQSQGTENLFNLGLTGLVLGGVI